VLIKMIPSRRKYSPAQFTHDAAIRIYMRPCAIDIPWVASSLTPPSPIKREGTFRMTHVGKYLPPSAPHGGRGMRHDPWGNIAPPVRPLRDRVWQGVKLRRAVPSLRHRRPGSVGTTYGREAAIRRDWSFLAACCGGSNSIAWSIASNASHVRLWEQIACTYENRHAYVRSDGY
jgi:hypothetical protein